MRRNITTLTTYANNIFIYCKAKLLRGLRCYESLRRSGIEKKVRCFTVQGAIKKNDPTVNFDWDDKGCEGSGRRSRRGRRRIGSGPEWVDEAYSPSHKQGKPEKQ